MIRECSPGSPAVYITMGMICGKVRFWA